MHSVFFFTDPATTEIYTLSLHDALPISVATATHLNDLATADRVRRLLSHEESCLSPYGPCSRNHAAPLLSDRLRSEGTRLNSSHSQISYAVFCLKKKKQQQLKKSEQYKQ